MYFVEQGEENRWFLYDENRLMVASVFQEADAREIAAALTALPGALCSPLAKSFSRMQIRRRGRREETRCLLSSLLRNCFQGGPSSSPNRKRPYRPTRHLLLSPLPKFPPEVIVEER